MSIKCKNKSGRSTHSVVYFDPETWSTINMNTPDFHFNRDTVSRLRVEIDQALQGIEKKYGLRIRAGRARFSESFCDVVLSAARVTDGGEVQTRELLDLKRWARSVGIGDQVLFQKFTTIDGKHYILTGRCPGRPRYPFLARSIDDGRTYKLSQVSVDLAFKL